MPNLTWITKKYFPQFSPHTINRGNCYNWAYVAYKKYNNVKLYSIGEYGGHAFVKINGKYFDAESPRGITHWANLEFLRGIYNPVIPDRQSISQFIEYWRKNGQHSIINVG